MQAVTKKTKLDFFRPESTVQSNKNPLSSINESKLSVPDSGSYSEAVNITTLTYCDRNSPPVHVIA